MSHLGLAGQTPTIRFVTKALGDRTSRLRERLKVNGMRRQIWIGAGIGITPFIAQMTQRAAEPSAVVVDLLHTTAVEEQAALARLQADAAAANVRLHLLVDARHGRLSGEPLRAAVPDWARASVWFCGLPHFVRALPQGAVPMR